MRLGQCDRNEGKRGYLGGVEIPNEVGLEGHSDADVVTHAVIDALLGACGLLHWTSPGDPTASPQDSLPALKSFPSPKTALLGRSKEEEE